MKATDILTHLNSLISYVPEDPVDRVIYGDPDREVTGIGVCFMPYRETLLRAHKAGINVIVGHEPTFYAHLDLDDEKAAAFPETKEKMKLMDELGITVVRCHDVWDSDCVKNNTLVGWANFLGLKMRGGTGDDRYVCEVKEQKAVDFARDVASRTAGLEQPQKVIRLYGDPNRLIKTVSVWGDPFSKIRGGADLCITYDDNSRMCAWVGSEWCRDTGYPMVVVNHGTLEEPGMGTLAEHLQEAFPDMLVTHLKQGCVYQEVSAK